MENNSRFNRDNYITILGWMITDLHLSGNELLCFAIVYGFSQTQGSKFSGSLSYLSDAMNITKDNARKVLTRLVDKDLLIKDIQLINNVRFCNYSVNIQGITETVTGVSLKQCQGITETVTNNTIYNTNNIREREHTREALDSSTALSLIVLYNTRIEHTSQCICETTNLPAHIRTALTERIREYGTEYVKETIIKATDPLCYCSTKPNMSLKWILDENNFSRIHNGEYDITPNTNGTNTQTTKPYNNRPTDAERQESFARFIEEKLATGRSLSDGLPGFKNPFT